ncbi:PfkB family carbohydrate kinase [Ruania halotolerans]|uniref:PfkB family carbohydrate kinase n=1 Tax=Ruania halotolerans TaxID=2897773 RepID=UPI001E50CD20|nr:PfkB family carbohydrate kinase [Ruania halotolerans]UFU05274.1 PfkB family carbohydrate kinase [Ruania halotolerans]
MTHPSAPGSAEPEFDVLLAGTVFFDIVFTGFDKPPSPGTEVWTHGMGSSPGGIANLAVATARLGLCTGLAAGFGDDLYGDWMWQVLRDQERVDLSRSRRFHAWHTPVTVSLAMNDDRSMVTHGHPPLEHVATLLDPPPTTRAVLADLGDPEVRAASWWRTAAAGGALVFADAGWDPAEQWDRRILTDLEGCHAFTPNAQEAMGYTRTDTPRAALHALADHVPLAVVTRGHEGVLAIDSATGEEAEVPALEVAAIDPTGAGDVFAAALVLGTLRGWPLTTRLRFSALCSSLAVQQFGGSLAAPGWGDISDWWRTMRARSAEGDPQAQVSTEAYGFLTDCLAGVTTRRVRRAEATIARFSDADRSSPDLEPPTTTRQEEEQS